MSAFFVEYSLYVLVASCWIVFLGFYISWLCDVRKANDPGTVVLRSIPPGNMTPSGMGYMTNKCFGEQLLAADIIDLAIRGFIKISQEKVGFWQYKVSVLTLEKDLSQISVRAERECYEKQLLEILFKSGKRIQISRCGKYPLRDALSFTRNYCECALDYFFFDTSAFFGQSLLPIILLIFIVISADNIPLMWCCLLFFGGMYGIASVSLRAYNPEGRRFQDAIDGFRLFLTTIDREDIQITPELFERYMPYAVALDIEHLWLQKCAAALEQREREGIPYKPSWYSGEDFRKLKWYYMLGRGLGYAIKYATSDDD